jgi:large conductance mechanosensitive channel protein
MAARVRKRSTNRDQTHTVTAGTTIRIEQPKSDRSKPGIATVVVQEFNPTAGFLNFLREHAVVGLAIGFVIGLQAQTLVKQLVDSFINPAFQLLIGGQMLSQRSFVLHFHGRAATFGWGAFVYILFNFLFVLAAIYIIYKVFKLDKLDKKDDEDKK